MASTIKVDNVQNQPGTNIINKCSVTTTIGAGAGETIKACAATVTLGRCGGTVALASGATQTGFGRTGTVDWITTPKVTGDSPITGVTGKGYFLNTTAGTITVNLPAGAAGSIVSVADYAGTWQTNNVTVAANGTEKIGGIDADVTLSTEGQSVTLVYVDSTQGWLNTMDSTSNVRGAGFVTATGGTPCTGAICGDYKTHTFTGPGTFCVSAIAPCASDNVVDYLIVGGGGAGAGRPNGGGVGGGGAGGVRVGTASASPTIPLSAPGYTVSVAPYAIVVGGGGANDPTANPAGASGNLSSGFSLAGAGGGGGTTAGNPGIAGGSGGGAGESPSSTSGGAGNTPPVSPPQGNGGGNSTCGSYGAGGGGIGGAGVNATSPMNSTKGAGGPGSDFGAVFGTANGTPGGFFAGGGGGSKGGSAYGQTAAPGGGGVGGENGGLTATAGGTNTGGGGGGNGVNNPAPGSESSAGGSGVVIIRYKFQ